MPTPTDVAADIMKQAGSNLRHYEPYTRDSIIQSVSLALDTARTEGAKAMQEAVISGLANAEKQRGATRIVRALDPQQVINEGK
jgi:hypothetical protein